MANFTKNELQLIQSCFQDKGWRGKRIVKEYPTRKWTATSVNRAIRRISKLDQSRNLVGEQLDPVKEQNGIGTLGTVNGVSKHAIGKSQCNDSKVTFARSDVCADADREIADVGRSVERNDDGSVIRADERRTVECGDSPLDLVTNVESPPVVVDDSASEVDVVSKYPVTSCDSSSEDDAVVVSKSPVTNGETRLDCGTSNNAEESCCNKTASIEVQNVVSSLLEDFDPAAIYVAIETSLIVQAASDSILFPTTKPQFEIMTVLLTCNLSGSSKRPLMVVGSCESPRRLSDEYSLLVDYANEEYARITEAIMMPRLEQWDEQLVDEKIVLMINSSSVGPSTKFCNIKIVPFPTSGDGIFDQGVVKTFVMLYRSEMQVKLVNTRYCRSLNLSDALSMMANAWNSFTERTFKNCFQKAGLVLTKAVDDERAEDSETWMDVDSYLAVELKVEDDD